MRWLRRQSEKPEFDHEEIEELEVSDFGFKMFFVNRIKIDTLSFLWF